MRQHLVDGGFQCLRWMTSGGIQQLKNSKKHDFIKGFEGANR